MKASRLSNLNAYCESSMWDTCMLDGFGRRSEDQHRLYIGGARHQGPRKILANEVKALLVHELR